MTITCCTLFAQDSTQNKDKGIIVLPAVFFSPETSLGFGGAGLFYFRTSKDSTAAPSNIQSIFIYTLENQILFTNPYGIFLKGDQYWLKGELGYYLYPYEYYGIGSDISLDRFEAYTASFLRFEVNALKLLKDNFYLGPTLFYDQYFHIKTDAEGELNQRNIRGVRGGQLLGGGASFVLDKRNNVFCPFRGYYLEGRVLQYQDAAFGDYAFTDIFFDARKYFHPADGWETAFQLYHQSVVGDVPFYNYALLGGGKRMRGYYRGAYRDHHFSTLQAEVRKYVFKRIIISAYGGIGGVNDTFASFDKLLGSYGVGLRYEINPEEHIRIRLDYARGHNTSGFYININEAF
ncbi:BamA/TamA family outer membrane protein [Marinoscillum furvescens]|nr:BamA/TamA family outer membrane protein [Marinoscillum furvescens]